MLGRETQAVLSPSTIWASRSTFLKYDLRTHSFNISQILIILVLQNLLRSIRPRYSQLKQLQHLCSQPELHLGTPTPGSVWGLPARAPSEGTQPGLRQGCAAGASPMPLPGRTAPRPTSLANGHLSVLVVLPSLLPSAPLPPAVSADVARTQSCSAFPFL